MTVHVQGLRKHFHDPERGQIHAVDKIDFQSHPGEIFGLLGPNGAGKTTTLRLLATLLSPSGGSATVAGNDILTDGPSVRRSIGYLSGTTGVYERMTPREMVRYFGQLFGMDEQRIAARTESLFELFEMGSFADRLCATLSDGMRQKVTLARTLVHDPPVLLLDEPTSSLDILVARTVTEFIREARSEGKCILLSTHDMNEATQLCDRLAILHKGRIVTSGTLSELRSLWGAEELEEIFFRAIGSERVDSRA